MPIPHPHAQVILEQDLIDRRERLTQSVTFARDLLKGLLLINGGAVIGLFTFLGNLAGKTDPQLHYDVRSVWLAFAFFGAGTLLAVAANVGAFLSQDWFFMQQDRLLGHEMRMAMQMEPLEDNWSNPGRAGELARWIGICLGIASLVAFGVGATFALVAVIVRP